MRCGSPVSAATERRAQARKVVSVLFCDLVGSTAAGEHLDPEDVSAILRRYYRVVRTVVEQHGGVLEKFVGDGAFAVFGVPSVHEDDAERAVRAGLAICDAATRLPGFGEGSLRLRIGVTTGEAVVHLGVEHGSGEGFITGSAANLAARLQGLAPVGGVLVDAATYRRTDAVIDYAARERVLVKGRSEPVEVHRALSPLATVPTGGRQRLVTRFVGRDVELGTLHDAFDRVVADGRASLVTVSGEPGLGKSRLVAALRESLDREGSSPVWRVGRCLPYSDGVGLWAFTEIVKAHAGILESDDAATTGDKLGSVVPAGADHDWLLQRLSPLLGLRTTAAAGRDELFAACRRFIEVIALDGPAVVVFEDVHWADATLLAGLAELARTPPDVPLLVLVTTRPELLEDRTPATEALAERCLPLRPLTDADTARIVAGLLDGAALSHDVEEEILRSAGGNALFAGEFVRLLVDRGSLVRSGDSWTLGEGESLLVPESIQALIAARLDTLPQHERDVLADASVVGGTFWPGAVAAISGTDDLSVREVLHRLEARDLVRTVPRTTLGEETELRFAHALVRDGAYAQLTRSDRAAKHREVARWIDSATGARKGDVVDILAHHWCTAVELQPSGSVDPEDRRAAMHWSTQAAERNLSLDIAAATSHLEQALALREVGDPGEVELLSISGRIAFQDGRTQDAARDMELAIAGYRAAGDVHGAVRTMMALAFVYQHLGDGRAFGLADEAVRMLSGLPASPELLEALAMQSGARTLAGGDPRSGVESAERAFEVADELGIERPPVALGFRGLSRFYLGDLGGLDDLRRAAELGERLGEGRDAALWMHNLAMLDHVARGPAASWTEFAYAQDFAARRGLREMETFARMGALEPLLDLGRIGTVLDDAERLEAGAVEAGSDYVLLYVRSLMVRAWVHVGRTERLADVCAWIEPASRLTGAPEDLAVGLSSCITGFAALGRDDEARCCADEMLAGSAASTWLVAPRLAALARALADDVDLVERLVGELDHPSPYAAAARLSAQAAIDEAAGLWPQAARLHSEAAEQFGRLDVPLEQWLSLQGSARCWAQVPDSTRAQASSSEARRVRATMTDGALLASSEAVGQLEV